MNTQTNRVASCYLMCLALLIVTSLATTAQRPPQRGVLMVSIDGLAPRYVTEADRHGLRIPTLRRILRDGSHASGVRGVLPTVTYPNHTTLITGVTPREHGIYQNVMFDPLGTNLGGWYWYSEDIRARTLWDAATEAGYAVGSVNWPASVGARHVKYLIPEFWRAGTPEDLKLLAILSTPGLLREIERTAGLYNTDINAGVAADWQRTRYAETIIREKHARFMTVHLAALDHLEHETGPFSRESLDTLEAIDQMVGGLDVAMRAEDPDSVVCIVSDHGFATSEHQFAIRKAFVDAGLMRVDAARPGTIVDWTAAPWTSGGGALIVLKDPKDLVLREKVRTLLMQLASDSSNGIEHVLDRQDIMTYGGTPEADFFVDMRSGYDVGSSLNGPLVRDIAIHGDHGFSPSHPEMRASLFLAGTTIRRGADLGDVDMRSIAPTIAALLHASLPGAPLPGLDVIALAPAAR
jgi:predicted AlkP superfamily pyrophosphatase or phosphodiesterase